MSPFKKYLLGYFPIEYKNLNYFFPSFSMPVVVCNDSGVSNAVLSRLTQRDRRAYLVGIENGRIGMEKDGRSGAGRRG